ncbi:MAG: TRAM domain-containing protein [Nitrosomonadales bacterium]
MNPVIIESLDHEGRGIAHADGKVIFIEGALTGERVTYSSYRKKNNYEQAQVGQVLKQSFMRVQPKLREFRSVRRVFHATSGRACAGRG